MTFLSYAVIIKKIDAMRFRFYILFLIPFCTVKFRAQETPSNKIEKRIYTTQRLKELPVIDGDISDDGWNAVSWSSDFVERSPDEGTAPKYQTQFKLMYDAQYLYVAIRAIDENPEGIQQGLTKRDGFAGDSVNVIIDSSQDKRTAFVFTTKAAGVKGEGIATQNGANCDASWNPIWYTDASR